jgi:hypothetical protein
LEDRWLDHGVCLDDLPSLLSYDQIRKLFYGVTEEKSAAGGGDDNNEGDQDGEGQTTEVAAEDDQGGGEGDGWGEPEEVTTPEIEVGTQVEFEYRGKAITGVVEEINEAKGLAKVNVGKDKPSVVKLDELTLAEPESDPVAAEAATDDGWGTGGDDGWGDYTPEPEPAPAGKKPPGRKKPPAGKK